MIKTIYIYIYIYIIIKIIQQIKKEITKLFLVWVHKHTERQLVQTILMTYFNCLAVLTKRTTTFYRITTIVVLSIYATWIYLIKVSCRNSRTIYEICSKSTKKHQNDVIWRRFGVFIVNYKQILNYIILSHSSSVDGFFLQSILICQVLLLG